MKSIFLAIVLLTVGNLNAQWTYKTNKNGPHDSFRLAYTPENNGATAYMLFIDSAVVLEVIDVVCDVNGEDQTFSFVGFKGESSDVVYITWDMELHPEFVDAFFLAKTMKIRINESKCDSPVYTFKMNQSKKAFEYIKNINNK
jgi:hypothetical protein